MKKLAMALLMIALMALLVACGAKDDEAADDKATGSGAEPEVAETEESELLTIKHDLGEAQIAKNPEKIVVFDFGMLDTLDELGIEVAGVPQANIPSYLSKYEDAKYTNVGGLKEPDFETIHAMKPDVIFISGRQSAMYEELNDIAPTIFVGVDTAKYMESFKGNMEMIAKLFGKEDKMAEELADIDSRIATVSEKSANTDGKSLIVLGNEGKVSAYGPSSRFGIIHDVFGFKAADENLEVSTHGQSISFEYILETNPDILFVIDRDAAVGGDASAKDSIENELVIKTNAYKDGKIIYLDPNYWYLSGGGLQSVKEMIKEIEEVL
ncbi:siderophore ABC transporter substrate-binding protein [Sporosarcina beigongshangi]|uniref:siderophore ABC transporter substrate-binding protein n=1 Tax=Sporosarcina beigongshangi TaxID=2782538 RepID=UPI001939DE9F|nr:siderophore ABC transporter substrate-binding protein [Sporosarcina beigongshangi]